MWRTKCLVCAGEDITTIIDLGMHPFADTFISEERASESDVVYPLICDVCKNCGQIQLKCVTNPEDRYIAHDYSYTSSNSNFSQTHWKEYASEVTSYVNLSNGSFVVEIGSNDGFLAEQFAQKGNKVLGVDPSPAMAELAKQRNVTTLVRLFSNTLAREIVSQYGPAQLIMANNVFNHSDNPLDFAKGVASLLAPGGTFVFELPYWCINIATGNFDQIYHEHVSYFTVRSAANLLERAGMSIARVQVVDYHGGSLRIYAVRREDLPTHCFDARVRMQQEIAAGTFNKDTYDLFMREVVAKKIQFLKNLYELKAQGNNIVAIGAAAKGNTFLNYYGLNSSFVDYVTDSSPYKIGKYTPLSRIPIRGDDVLSKYNKVHALILSWNISSQLKNILLKINPRVEFITR
jgi:SAM-dependent methyltransferase